MILPALGKHGYDLCQEEQRLVDVLAFLDSHTFGISVGAAPSIRLGAAARCGAKRTWISHSGAEWDACAVACLVDACSLRSCKVDEVDDGLGAYIGVRGYIRLFVVFFKRHIVDY